MPDPAEGEPVEPDWNVVKEIVADALERAPDTRSAFLDEACDGDAALRSEVESLIGDDTKTSTGTSGFLETPAAALFNVPSPEPGTTIGGYRLISVIGEGGMGRVFEAEQSSPQRTVALKILRPGFLSADAERRFHYEIEALGRLSHPAIASVLEAGVEETDGGHVLSWFAMERVEGKPLLHAAEDLELGRRDRLFLFLRITDAIAHAHQRGIIHRDLKPDNILVDDERRPHVLDFGIARAADPMASAVTTAGEIVGTLSYMSPEQVLGEPEKVDAQSDVYALGVLLYRLLTGEPPLQLDGLSLPKVALALSREDPRPAGEIDATLRGDLETILQTALARDPDRRYPTVDAFAADIKRSLNDEPIAARPPTALYQLSKFARRNRGLVVGLSLAFLCAIGAAIGTTFGLVRANDARAVAEIERDRARDANKFMKRVFSSARPDIDGRDTRVIDLLDTAMAEMEADEDLDLAVRAGLYLTLGDTYRNLGEQVAARSALERAVTGFHSVEPYGLGAIEAHAALCDVLYDLGEVELAEESRAYVDRGFELADDPPAWLRMRPLELAIARALRVGDTDAYLETSREALDAWVLEEGAAGDSALVARTTHSNALMRAGEYEAAKTLLEEGIEAASDVYGETHPRVLTQRANLATVATDLGDWEGADDITAEILPLAEEVWGPSHPKTFAVRLARASVLQHQGDLDGARVLWEQNATLAEETYGVEHDSTVLARHNAAVGAMYLEDHARAEELTRENLAILEARPEATSDPIMVLQTRMALANALDLQGRLDEALPLARASLAQLEELAGEGHPQTLISRNSLLSILIKLGLGDEAVDVAEHNLALAEESQPGHRNNMFPFRSNLGRALAVRGDFEAALEALRAVETFLESDPNTAERETDRIEELLSQTRDLQRDAVER